MCDEFINISNMDIVAHDGAEFTFANGVSMYFQKDGNFVAYNSSGTPVAATGSNGNYGQGTLSLLFQDDGNLVIYTGGKAVWASNTAPQARGGHLYLQDKSPYIRILDASGKVVYTAKEG